MAVRVQAEPFDLTGEVNALTAGRMDIGAIVTFSGVVRGNDTGQPLEALMLEHYPGMTEAELSRVEALAHARWHLHASLIIHRVGTLRPGEGIVLVIAASAHRGDAFEAASFLMDYLKTSAPFWKKELLLDGSGSWVDARDSDATARARWEPGL